MTSRKLRIYFDHSWVQRDALFPLSSKTNPAGMKAGIAPRRPRRITLTTNGIQGLVGTVAAKESEFPNTDGRYRRPEQAVDHRQGECCPAGAFRRGTKPARNVAMSP